MLLRLIKKHFAACAKSSETDWKCRPKDSRIKAVACPFYIVGVDPRNRLNGRIKKHTHTSNEATAKMALFVFERSLFDPTAQKPEEPKTTIEQAIDFWINTKAHKSEDRQGRLRRQITEMRTWLKSTFRHTLVTEVRKTDLEQFMFSWSGTYSTLVTRRENLKSFYKYCFDSDFVPKNIAASLPTVGDDRQRKEQRIPTFTEEERDAILRAADDCGDLYQREGLHVAEQVRVFTFLQRYTGMAIGDVTKLRRDEVSGNQIMVNRKKTGEAVWTSVPQFVAEALSEMKVDSPEYYFWSGNGKLHTRTGKWGNRLQKLFVYAGVRVREESKTRRSGGKLKKTPELLMVSAATPHMWRHTFVRDHYLSGTSVEDIADLIGDDAETVRRHYSCFDHLRQKKLLKRQEVLWSADPFAISKRCGTGAQVQTTAA